MVWSLWSPFDEVHTDGDSRDLDIQHPHDTNARSTPMAESCLEGKCDPTALLSARFLNRRISMCEVSRVEPRTRCAILGEEIMLQELFHAGEKICLLPVIVLMFIAIPYMLDDLIGWLKGE